MGDLSVVELAIYGFVELLSLSMLIVSVIKEVPSGRSSSIVRVIYLIPGIFCAGILGYTGQDIITGEVTNLTRNLNTSEVWSETQNLSIPLQQPVWITFHFAIMVILILYVITQLLSMLLKKE